MNTIAFLLTVIAGLVVGAALWSLAEYVLHRFAMHAMGGRGIMSREHLEHHVTSGWTFSRTHLLSWLGVAVVGGVLWLPLGWLAVGPVLGVALGLGWVLGYAWYELQHALSHLQGPSGRYSRWLRRHHFHHHFGHPQANHGVTTAFWDRAFGTLEHPERVRVPRRLALPWMVDADGVLRSELADDYVLVGAERADERRAGLDRARAFASLPPLD